MGECISFRISNNQYKFIIFYLLFELFNEITYELNYYDKLNGIKVFFMEKNNIFKDFTFVRRKITGYFGTFILTIISFVYNIIKIRKEQNTNIDKGKSCVTGKISLIHDDNIEDDKPEISILNILVIIFGWVLEEQAIDKYEKTLSHLDFWMLELIIICYLNSKMFHIEIYKHQIFVLFFSLIPILFKIITIILEMNDSNDRQYPYETKHYLKCLWM